MATSSGSVALGEKQPPKKRKYYSSFGTKWITARFLTDLVFYENQSRSSTNSFSHGASFTSSEWRQLRRISLNALGKKESPRERREKTKKASAQNWPLGVFLLIQSSSFGHHHPFCLFFRCIDSYCSLLLVCLLRMQKKKKKNKEREHGYHFHLPPLPPMWMSPWLRYLPSLHKVNVPSCRTNPAQSVGPQPIQRFPDWRKHVWQFVSGPTCDLCLQDYMHVSRVAFWGACGSTITNRIAEDEMSTALEQISNKGTICAAGIPEGLIRFCSFMSGRCDGLIPEGEKGGKKMRWAHERSCSTSCRGWVYTASRKSRSNQPSHIHPTQWKMNDMKTCWHVKVYSNSHFGLIAPTAKED